MVQQRHCSIAVKTTCKRKHFIAVLLTASEGEYMTVMVESMAADRRGSETLAESLHHKQQTQNEDRVRLVWMWAWNLQSLPLVAHSLQ